MRLAYVTFGWSGHDQRFVDGWGNAGLSVKSFNLDSTSAEGPGSFNRFGESLLAWDPHLVQAGPLNSLMDIVIDHWSGPLIATSCGFDLLETGPSVEDPADLERRLSAATLLFVDSEPGKQRAISLGMQRDRIRTFPWGVDLLDFQPNCSPAQFGNPSPECTLLSLRRLEPLYDVETIIRGFAALRSSMPASLIIASDGSEKARLTELAIRLGIAKDVEFRGEVDRDELRCLLHEADIYVSASLTDGTSVSLIEALASGLPAVISNIPGNRPWALPGAVELFEVRDSQGLVQRVHGLLNVWQLDPTQRATACRNVRRLAEERADWSRTLGLFPDFARDCIELYRRDNQMRSSGL